MFIAILFLYALIGIALQHSGLNTTNWQWWVVLLSTAAIDILSALRERG